MIFRVFIILMNLYTLSRSSEYSVSFFYCKVKSGNQHRTLWGQIGGIFIFSQGHLFSLPTIGLWVCELAQVLKLHQQSCCLFPCCGKSCICYLKIIFWLKSQVAPKLAVHLSCYPKLLGVSTIATDPSTLVATSTLLSITVNMSTFPLWRKCCHLKLAILKSYHPH